MAKEIAMRGMLVLAAAMTVCAATPAAANWGYSNGGASYGYGGGDYAYSGYGAYGGYGYGYGNLSSHGAAMPSWGDCPCCNNVWAGYCEEKAARAANRHCNSCGTGGCGRVKHLGRKCGKSCDACGSAAGDCGCNGATAAADEIPTTDQPTPPPVPDAAAPEAPAAPPATPPASASTNATQLPLLSGIAWLTAVVLNR
jgi:hypothetical protein